MKNVFHVGGPIVVTNQSSEFTAIRTVSKTARDGRVQVGKDWFTPGVPDKYGRIARMLTDSEREEWELEKRMEAALRALSCLPVTESLATSVEKLLNVELQMLSKPSAKACQVTPADATAQQENTLIHYLYRDGSNYKRGQQVIVTGAFTEEQREQILDSLDDGYLFIPEQVGLPCDRLDEYERCEDDTCYCELYAEDFELVNLPPTEELHGLTIAELTARFVEAKDNWDCLKYSPF